MKIIKAAPGEDSGGNHVVEAPVPKATPEQLDEFMREWWHMTEGHPFVRGMRLTGGVGVELRPYKYEGTIHISSIMSFEQKNAGQASAVLKKICDLADKHKMTLDLFVKPIKNAGARDGQDLNARQLKGWYARHGFKPSKRGGEMVREPMPQ